MWPANPAIKHVTDKPWYSHSTSLCGCVETANTRMLTMLTLGDFAKLRKWRGNAMQFCISKLYRWIGNDSSDSSDSSDYSNDCSTICIPHFTDLVHEKRPAMAWGSCSGQGILIWFVPSKMLGPTVQPPRNPGLDPQAYRKVRGHNRGRGSRCWCRSGGRAFILRRGLPGVWDVGLRGAAPKSCLLVYNHLLSPSSTLVVGVINQLSWLWGPTLYGLNKLGVSENGLQKKHKWRGTISRCGYRDQLWVEVRDDLAGLSSKTGWLEVSINLNHVLQ